MPSEDVEIFLHNLKRSRLLSQEQLGEVSARLDLRNEPTALRVAEALLKEKLVTRFQARRLLGGESRGFYVGGYKLLEILGAGGMGRLYRAQQGDSDVVALKVLADDQKRVPGMLARFKLEAQVGKRLDHPNIVKVLEIGQAEDLFDDLHYVVMEFVEGLNLWELVTLHGPIPWPQACDFIMQAAAGLEHAHAHGLVHRDVKPANLLIDREGHVKILDFGLVRHAEDEFSLAMIFGQDCLGTADYMAPEQVRDSYAVDPRADVYSLGCTLYFALTAEVPFASAESVRQKLEAHQNAALRPVRDLIPNVPESVEKVVSRMLSKQPEDRIQTAQDVQKALRPFAKRRKVNFDFRAILAARARAFDKRGSSLRRSGGADTTRRQERPGA